MPIIKSAKKSLRVDKRRKLENDIIRAKIKNAIKGAKISIANKKEDVREKLDLLYSELDRAAKKNVVHRNKAARLKSRITKSAAKSSLIDQKLIKKTNDIKKTPKKQS